MFNFDRAEYFETEDPAVRVAPTVDFGTGAAGSAPAGPAAPSGPPYGGPATEDRIAAGRRFYNANVRELNTKVESFPGNLIANAFHITKAEYFEVEEPSLREAPEVSF